MNKKLKILFFCMIFVSTAGSAQVMPALKSNLLLDLQGKTIAWQPSFFLKRTPAAPGKPILAPDFYASQLGFFCKQEIKMDKLIRLPVRFRLGGVEQCDRLEGKRR